MGRVAGHRGAPSGAARRVAWVAVAFACAWAPLSASAQPQIATAAPAPTSTAWSRGEARWFVATLVDVGVLYLRPRASLGWGVPHHRWLGVDVNPIIASEGYGGWAGLRFALPSVDLRVGARRFIAFRRALLAPQSAFDRGAIERRVGPDARYTSLEAELTWAAPLLDAGHVIGEAALTWVTGVREGWWVYEETARAVVAPPWLWRLRLGFSFAAGFDGALSLAPVVELIGSPERDAVTLRAGILARVALYDDLEARATFVPALLGPDALGLAGADAFHIGLRWRWATPSAGGARGDRP